MNRWGLFVLGVGGGLLAGALMAEVAALFGAVAVALGLVLLIVGASRGKGDLIADAATQAGKPALAGLGVRAEQILTLAETQAAEHVAVAKEEAARIVAEARAEADRLKRQ